ncbi:MAG TPA: endonuclease [Bacteroidales bacterium]|nr:endonuclease [Bacteroidales bacterium]
MDKILAVIVLYFSGLVLYAQIPGGYYDSASGLSGSSLQQALHNIIDDHTVITYSELWDYFQQTDKKSNGKVWDIYSDIPGGTPPYEFTFIVDQCGNYSQEGDCYNREHSFPKSWFGGDIYPMFSDLFQIYPTDGWVNNKRGNFPYGEVGIASWTSMNGSKLGECNVNGYTGTVFEPIDDFKGDLARMHFYMATRYLGEDSNWPGSDAVYGAQMKEWALNMLHSWHQNDPVSTKETDRNNAVYQIQNNRNPFVDHPEFVDLIWFYSSTDNQNALLSNIRIYPNPAEDFITVDLSADQSHCDYRITITDPAGRIIFENYYHGKEKYQVDISTLSEGFYFITISECNKQISNTFKLIK